MTDLQSLDTVRLVKASVDGDKAAVEALFSRYYPRVCQIVALRMGRTMQQFGDLEDIAQESMLDALRGLASFEHRSEGTFRNWLACVVENNLRDEARKMQAQRRGGGRVRPRAAYNSSVLRDSVFPGKEATPSQHAAAAELMEKVEKAMLALPERERRAIELRKLCEMSYEELAAELGLGSAASARSLLARAMSRLSSQL